MRFVLKTLATALVIGLVLPSYERRARRRRQQHRHDSGPRRRQQRRGAARRDRDRDEPVDDRHADAGHQRERLVSFSRRASGRLRADVRAGRLQHRQARAASRSRSGFTANVNAELAVATLQETVTVTGESPVIDTSATRVQQNFKLAQLESIPNGRDMWALLAATPGVIMSQHRRRRQSRRHADRLPGLRLERPGAHLGRRHQHHRRHRRRRLLLRLRLIRRSVPRRRRPGRGSGDARRAVELPRQVGRQPVLRRVLRRLATTTRSRART